MPFGDHLKREREMRGVTIGEIAAATRISERFLEALENERWEQLPGGAFNRGFVRSVARFLGLDEESMVAEYVLETKERSQGDSASESSPQGMPRDWRPVIALAVGLVVLAIIAAIGVHYYRAHARARQQRLEQQSAPAPRTPVAPPISSPSETPPSSSPGGPH